MAKYWMPYVKEEYVPQRGPHSFTKKMIKIWLYCAHCGLILLSNDVSQRAARRLCEY